MDEKFAKKMKKTDLEFTIFDDNAEIGDDFVGRARINLKKLLNQDALVKDDVEIIDNQ